MAYSKQMVTFLNSNKLPESEEGSTLNDAWNR
jgi:hypothetical protein